MSPLLMALAFVIVALFVYMGRYSGRVLAEQSRFIAAPPEAVRARVADLSQWQAWNPWLEHAPSSSGNVHSDGALHWDIPAVGRARVQALLVRKAGTLRQRLAFDLPFACRGRSDWRIEPAPGGCRVSWRFKGRVAFTLRAFAATVQGATALDLRFGLDRLAAALQGSPAYTLDYQGPQAQPKRQCAHQSHRGPLDTLAADLPPRIAAVRAQLAGAGLPARGTAVVLYLKTQLRQRIVDCKVGVDMADTAMLPDTVGTHAMPAHEAYVLRFDGPPETLEPGRYQAMQRMRVELRQPHPLLPPYAVYEGESAPGRRGVVWLHLPLKG